MANTWDYSDTSWSEGSDLVGYDVEATDGSIGSIDETSNEAGSAYVVVDTGFWIFGKKRLIPAGSISDVDHQSRVVRVAMTKDAIKDAPDYDADHWDDDSRGRHDDYYGDSSRRDDTRRDDRRDPDNPLV
jgi:hypothetical protein